MKRRILTMIVAVVAMASMAACSPTRTTRSGGETLDDATVTAKVKTALARDPSTSAYRIEVETFRGEVQLNGFVETSDMKSSATRVAKSVGGVQKVSNNLKVSTGERTAGEVVDDGVITAKVKAALVSDPNVAAHEVNVQTREGVVQLAGFVDTGDQKAKASEVTRRIAGVKQVDNQLEVKTR
ncbi:MAG: BON domain-containing protein [Gammaproteobacteria bacterium]